MILIVVFLFVCFCCGIGSSSFYFSHPYIRTHTRNWLKKQNKIVPFVDVDHRLFFCVQPMDFIRRISRFLRELNRDNNVQVCCFAFFVSMLFVFRFVLYLRLCFSYSLFVLVSNSFLALVFLCSLSLRIPLTKHSIVSCLILILREF